MKQHLLSKCGGLGQRPRAAKIKIKEKKIRQTVNKMSRHRYGNSRLWKRQSCARMREALGLKLGFPQRRKLKTQYVPKSETITVAV